MFTLLRDAVSVSLKKLSETVNSLILVDLVDHTPGVPSTLEIARKLPGTNGKVRRVFLNRKLARDISGEGELPNVITAHARLELIIPNEFDAADVTIMTDDIVGVLNHADMSDLSLYGILPEA